MRRDTTCVLCGTESNDVSVGLIEWKEPPPSRFTAAPRCRDHNACRTRVELLGEPWDLTDTTRTTREIMEAAG